MPKYRFEEIAINSTEKKKPVEADKETYIGLEHLDSGCLQVTRWGTDVAPIGDKLIMHKGDVLFGRRRAYQKKVAIAPFDGIFSAHGMVLRPRTEVISERLFPFFIGSDDFLDAAIKISVGSLSPTINWRDLKELSFSIPPLDKQEALADDLWAFEETKEAYSQLMAATEALVKSQFIEMFGADAVKKYGWSIFRLSEVCKTPDDIKCGPFGTQLSKSEFQSEGVPIWGIPQINTAFVAPAVDFLTTEKAERLEAYSLLPGDIVMSRKGNVGMCAIYPKSFPKGIMHSDALRIRVDLNRINPVFLMQQLHISPAVKQQIDIVSVGAIMAGVNVTKLKKIEICVPPTEPQNRFAAFVESTDKSKFALQQNIERLDMCRNALMQKAFG